MDSVYGIWDMMLKLLPVYVNSLYCSDRDYNINNKKWMKSSSCPTVPTVFLKLCCLHEDVLTLFSVEY